MTLRTLGTNTTTLNNAYVVVTKPEQYGAVGDGVIDDSDAFAAINNLGTSSSSRVLCLLTSGKNYKVKSGVLARTQTRGLLAITTLGERGSATITIDGQGAGTSFLDASWTTSAATNLPYSITKVRFVGVGAFDAIVKNTDASNGIFRHNLIEGERSLIADVWVRNIRFWCERVKVEHNRELSRTVVNGGSGRVFYFDSAGVSVGTGLVLSAAADTVTRVAHGLIDGWAVKVTASTAGGVSNGTYYVVNATADTFQIAASVGDVPLDITVDGTATVKTGSASFKGAWVRLNEFTAGVPGVCKVDMSDDSACYDSIFGPHLGNISGGDIVQKLAGNMRGTVVHQPQVEASSDFGYSFEVGGFSGGNRPTIRGNFSTQSHLREFYVSDATNAALGLGVLGTGLTLSAASDTVTKAAHGLIHDSRVQLASNTAGGVANAITYYVTGTVVGAGLALSAASNTVTAIAHGLPNGTVVELSANTASGVSNGNTYYVVNATADTFQLATTANGSARDITADGTATVNAVLADSFKLAAARGAPALDITSDGNATVIAETYALPPGSLTLQNTVLRGATIVNQQTRSGVDLREARTQAFNSPINPVVFPSSNAGGVGPFNRNDNLVEQLSGSTAAKYILNRDGSVHWTTDNSTATTTQLNDTAHSVNVNGKYRGKTVYNTTTKTNWVADGPLAADPWYDQGATSYSADTITADVTPLTTAATPTEVFQTGSLGVGTWKIDAFICVNIPAASTASSMSAQATGGSATYTIVGGGAGASTQDVTPSNSTPNSQTTTLHLHFVAVVTSAGTISIRARSSATGTAKASTPSTTPLPGATGYVATKLA